jgi:hypothetical protein
LRIKGSPPPPAGILASETKELLNTDRAVSSRRDPRRLVGMLNRGSFGLGIERRIKR